MPSIAIQLSPQERDFDLLFLEEFAFNSEFLHRIIDRLGIGQTSIQSIRHSVHENLGGDAWGETDLLVHLFQGPTLLIENKLSAPFQDGQALRYRARALHHSSNGIPALTMLFAPSVYLIGVSRSDWQHVFSYQDLAEMISLDDPRSNWRRSLLNAAGTRSARVSQLAANAGVRKAVAAELAAFKVAWQQHITESGEWQANPQTGSTDEYLYRPRYNPQGLTIWQHPMAGYLSVQIPPKHAQQVKDNLPAPLPEGMRLRTHPSTIYLDAATQPIDMSAPFETERPKVEASMAIARQALDIVETALVNPVSVR